MGWAVTSVVALAVAAEGFRTGLAFRRRQVWLGPGALAFVALVTGGAAALASTVGRALHACTSTLGAQGVSAALLLALGVTLGCEPRWGSEPKVRARDGEAAGWAVWSVGFVLATTAAVAAFALELSGLGSAFVPLTIGVVQTLTTGWGNLAARGAFPEGLACRLGSMAGGVLVLLGLWRLC